MSKAIEWFRVADDKKTVFPTATLIVCRECLTAFRYTLINRVFGASQVCAKCGKTDRLTK